jgi:hypothetical protein
MSALADTLVEQFEPVSSPALTSLIRSSALMFEEAEALVRDTAVGVPGLAVPLNPEEAPLKWLPWVGQFVGVRGIARGRVALRKNLVTNPRPGAGNLDGYAANGSFLNPGSILTGQSDAIRVVTPGTAAFEGVAYVLPNLETGKQYSIRVDVKRNDASATLIEIFLGQDSAPFGEHVLTRVANPNNAAFTSYSGVIQAVGAGVHRIIVRTAAQASISFDVTKVSTVQEAVVSPYFDPALNPDARWDGAAYHSTSTLYRDETDPEFRTRASTLIEQRRSERRGGVEDILEGVQMYLTGNKTVLYNERGVGGSAWHGNIAAFNAEALASAATIQAEINRRKPVGTIIDFTLISGADYAALKNTHTDYADVKAQFPDYAAVKSNPSLT